MATEKLLARNSKAQHKADFLQRIKSAVSSYHQWKEEKKADVSMAGYAGYVYRERQEKAKDFNFFKWIFAKHNRTGRFGRKTAKEKNDSIKAMDSGWDSAQTPFFNPFAAIPQQGAEGDTPLVEDFVERVQQEMDIEKKSDFEGKKFTDKDDIALLLPFVGKSADKNGNVAEESINQVAEMASEYFDATKEFVTDEGRVNAEVPDDFEVSLDVAPASDFYLDYTVATTNARKRHFGKKADDRPIIISLLKKDPEFNRLVEERKKTNPKYDPNKDSDNDQLNKMISNVRGAVSAGTGHGFVSLISKKQGSTLNTYSFGFCPTGNAPLGGVTAGDIRNPDPYAGHQGVISKRYSIKYSDYLRAAARVRGVRGSARTYSTLGYNCTSFATEIAQAAGAPIGNKDSSVDIATYAHRSQRVDMPAALQRFIKEQLKKDDEKRAVIAQKAGQMPLITQLYGEKGSDAEKQNFISALFEAIDTAPMEALGAIDGFNPQAKGSVREQFKEFAVASQENLQKAITLGVRIPGYTDMNVKGIRERMGGLTGNWFNLIVTNKAFTEKISSIAYQSDAVAAANRLLNHIIDKVNYALTRIEEEPEFPEVITSVAQALALKDAAAERKEILTEELGTADYEPVEYITRLCKDNERLGNLIDELAESDRREREEKRKAQAAEREANKPFARNFISEVLEENEEYCEVEMNMLGYSLAALRSGQLSFEAGNKDGMLKLLLKLSEKDDDFMDKLIAVSGKSKAAAWMDVVMIMRSLAAGGVKRDTLLAALKELDFLE